jgi:hypothetical protein
MENGSNQGCRMAYFQTQNPSLGNFYSVLQWAMLVYFTAICDILLQCPIFPVLECCNKKNLATLVQMQFLHGLVNAVNKKVP